MLSSSSFTITLNKSRDYLKCVIISYASAMIALFYSAVPTWMFSISCIVSLLILGRTLYYSKPPPYYGKLSYYQHHWFLHHVNGEQSRVEQLNVCFDGGLFVWLTMSSRSKTHNVLIFKDQLSQSEYRMLRFIEQNKPLH